MANLPVADMNLQARQEIILETLRRDGKIRVAEFSAQTGVSAVTVRKDLDRLEQEGLLFRVHGGAISAPIARNEHNYNERRSNKKAEKQLIAKAVSRLVQDGESILINVGTTSEYVIDELKSKQDLIVITNALPILERLNYCENITSFFLGGRFETNMQITIGENVIEQLARYTPDKLIMGMDGVDPVSGLTSRNHVEDYIMRQMLSQSKEKILVVDDSKIGNSSLIHVCDVSEFDILVTNYCPENEEKLRQIEKKGVRVIIAR